MKKSLQVNSNSCTQNQNIQQNTIQNQEMKINQVISKECSKIPDGTGQSSSNIGKPRKLPSVFTEEFQQGTGLTYN